MPLSLTLAELSVPFLDLFKLSLKERAEVWIRIRSDPIMYGMFQIRVARKISGNTAVLWVVGFNKVVYGSILSNRIRIKLPLKFNVFIEKRESYLIRNRIMTLKGTLINCFPTCATIVIENKKSVKIRKIRNSILIKLPELTFQWQDW